MQEQVGIYSERDVQASQALVKELIRVVRGFKLYASNHPTLARMIDQLNLRWAEATAAGSVALGLSPQEVTLDEEVIYKPAARNEILPTILYDHGVVGLVLNSGAESDELRRFAGVLATDPDPTTDYGSLLWEADLASVQTLLDSDHLDSPLTAKTFGPELARVAEDDDPPVEPQYEQERNALDRMQADLDELELDEDNFKLTPIERDRLARLVEDENYATSVRHAARVVHSLAREDLSAKEAEPLERTMKTLVATTCTMADVAGAIELIQRAHEMRKSEHDLELQVGELTYACFVDPQNLQQLFAGLDKQEFLEARSLGDLLTQLGSAAAPEVGRWLIETKHHAIVAQAMRLFGEDATTVLAPLYDSGSFEERDRIGPALLEIGTPHALRPLANQLSTLDEANRLQILKALGRTTDPELREVIVRSLDDASERVRRAAAEVLKKVDAPFVATVLERMFERQVFEERSEEEVAEFFETLSRIGDRAIAEVMAVQCRVRGIRRHFLKPTPLQELTLRALRRARDAGAREVAARLKKSAPRAMREILDDQYDF